MAETKHTPGPWVWSENTSEDGHMIRMGTALTDSPTYSPIHVIDYNHDADPEDEEFLEAEANAQLIAAAPDMLEACMGGPGEKDNALDDSLDWLADRLDRNDFDTALKRTVAVVLRQYAVILRAAIAKATGKEPS